MVERPVKPAMASVEESDELVAEFLDTILNKELSVSGFSTVDPVSGEEFTYKQLQKKSQARVLDRVTYSALKELFLSLPRRFDIIKRSLTEDFKRLITHRQDLFEYVDEMENYADLMESRVERLERQLSISDTELSKVRDELRGAVLVAKERALDELLKKYGLQSSSVGGVTFPKPKSVLLREQDKKEEETKSGEEKTEEDKEIDFRK